MKFHVEGRARSGTGIHSLSVASQMWGTPTARDWKGTGDLTNVPENGLLGRMASNWTSPSASDAGRGGTITEAMTGTSLAQQVNSLWSTPEEKLWPTPKASEAEHSGRIATTGRRDELALTQVANQWPTPTSLSFGDSHQPGNSRSYNKTMEMARGISQSSRRDLRTSPPGAPSRQPILMAFRRYRAMTDLKLRSEMRALIRLAIRAEKRGERRSFTRPSFRRQLNATFVEKLMGWPPGWTSFACSEMAFAAFKQRMRSELLSLGLPIEGPPAQGSLFA